MKQCSKCMETKPLNDFFKDKRLSSGYRADCKKCCARRAREYKQTEHGKSMVKNWWNSESGKALKERRREVDKQRVMRHNKTDKGKETHKKAATKYRQNHTDKVKAHNAIRVEKSRGTIPTDYSKPLEVIPVCSTCHANIHKHTE